MTSDEQLKDQQRGVENGRNPLYLMAGLGILGIALTLLIFGDSFFGPSTTAESSILKQIPAFEPATDSIIQSTGSNSLEIGVPAYNFTLNDVSGNSVQLDEFAGQPIIINFWATWCAPCRDEMPELEAAYKAHQEDGLVILAVNQQESKEAVAQFFDELDLTFTPLLDVEKTVANLYSVTNILPTTFFINAEGLVTAIHRGPLNLLQIDSYLMQEMP